MEIQITHYIDPAEDNERFQIHVLENAYLADFAIEDPYGHRYHFEPQLVKKGDKIILFTGPGEARVIGPEEPGDPPETIYCYHWGVDSTMWDPEEDNISLIKGEDIEADLLEELLFVTGDNG